MRVHRWEIIFLILFVLISPMLFTGCGGSRLDAEEVIAQAKVAINEVQSYRAEIMSIYTENGEINESSVQMEFVLPDCIHLTTVDGTGTRESIWIGSTEYRLDADGNEWRVHQWSERLGLGNMAVAAVESLDSLVGLVEMADEKIDGIDCFHYQGSVDMKAKAEEGKANLDPLQSDYEEQMRAWEQYARWQLNYEFWVGKKDYLLRKVKPHQEGVFIRDAGEDTEKEEHLISTATYRFFDFNAPIEIEPPIIEQDE